MKKIILDTNSYSMLLAGDTCIRDILGEADAVFISVVVLVELYVGFGCGNKEKENRKILNEFLTKCHTSRRSRGSGSGENPVLHKSHLE